MIKNIAFLTLLALQSSEVEPIVKFFVVENVQIGRSEEVNN